MSYFKQLAKILGVENDVRFNIKYPDGKSTFNKYYITEDGLYDEYLDMYRNDLIVPILSCEYEIVIIKYLTEDEKIILRNFDNRWKWITRDKDGALYIYEDKPKKTESNYFPSKGCYTGLFSFANILKCIKWEDEEPTLISKLLKDNE